MYPDPTSSDIADVAAFVTALRRLKAWAGDPSFEELSRRTSLPRSTLHDAFNTRRAKLPRLDVVRRVVRACGVPDERCKDWDDVWRAVTSERAESPQESPRHGTDQVPRQLPGVVRGYVGRLAESDTLDEALLGGPGGVAVICGTAGVGKSTLAATWATLRSAQFPDGQIYVNLHAFSQEPRLSTTEALEYLIRSLSSPGVPMPHDDAGLLATYRSLLANRRVLIVLDNALNSAQVRPLLPPYGECATIITSRDAMAGLVARDGARRVCLHGLALDEAVELFSALGGPAVAAPSGDLDDLIELVRCCKGLPLTLRLVAEMVIARPRVGIGDLLAELNGATLRRLDAGGDGETSLRAVVSWSYQNLPAQSARTFRLLGQHPGSEFGVDAVAAVTGLSTVDAEGALGPLRQTHMLVEAAPDRFVLHDLMHQFAAQLAAELPADEVGSRRRLLEYYIDEAEIRRDALYPYDRPVERLTEVPPELDGPRQWLDRERRTLMAYATDRRFGATDADVVALSEVLHRYLHVRGYLGEAVTIHTAAIRAARASADLRAEGRASAYLGRALAQQGEYTRAFEVLERAARLCSTSDDLRMLDLVFSSLGACHLALGHRDRARESMQAALDIARAVGDHYGAAGALNHLGTWEREHGRLDKAGRLHLEAAAGYRDCSCRAGEGATLLELGRVRVLQGDRDDAVGFLAEALLCAQETGWLTLEIATLLDLGMTVRARAEAETTLRKARALARELGDEQAADRAEALMRLLPFGGTATDRRTVDEVSAPVG